MCSCRCYRCRLEYMNQSRAMGSRALGRILTCDYHVRFQIAACATAQRQGNWSWGGRLPGQSGGFAGCDHNGPIDDGRILIGASLRGDCCDQADQGREGCETHGGCIRYCYRSGWRRNATCGLKWQLFTQ